MRHVFALVWFLVSFVVLASAPLPGQGWVDVSNPANTPGGSDGAAMVYDEARNCCLLIRGSSTWKYDANGWSQVNSANPATVGVGGLDVYMQKAVYDSTRQRVVVAFGCRDNLPFACLATADIRCAEWDGVNWVAIPGIPSVASGGWNCGYPIMMWQLGFDMAYDQARSEVVLHSAGTGGGVRTYTYGNGQWSLRSPLITPNMAWTSTRRMFYEEHSGRVVLVNQNPPSYWE